MRTLLSMILLTILAPALAAAQDDLDLDPSRFIQAPGRMELGPGVKVGYRYEVVTTLGENDSTREFTAIVGETKDTWEVETTVGLSRILFRGIPVGRGMVMALVVDKQTHKVLIAKIGNAPKTDETNRPFIRFKGLRDLKIGEPDKVQQATRSEKVLLPSGERIQADLYVRADGKRTITRWVGAKGSNLAGVLLKLECAGGGADEDYGLAATPARDELKLEDEDAAGKPVSLEVLRLQYSNGEVRWVIGDHAVAKAFKLRTVQSRTEDFSKVLVSLRRDAKKTLAWN